MSQGPAEDDPFHPSRWQSDPGGPITGEDLAYLKDLIHSRMGFETERFSAVRREERPVAPVEAPAPGERWWKRLRRGLGR